MKFSITIRKILLAFFCIVVCYSAVKYLPLAKVFGTKIIIADVSLVVLNIGVIVLSFFNIKRGFLSFLYWIAFGLIVYMLSINKLQFDDDFTILLCAAFLSWFIFVGIKRIIYWLFLPYYVFKKKNSSGTKWICNCAIDNNGHICGYETFTFKGRTPAPTSRLGCPWSIDHRHNFVIKSSGYDFNSQLNNVFAWIGCIVGFGITLFSIISNIR